MAGESKRRGLGRGLSALLGEEISAAPEGEASLNATMEVPVELLYPGRLQPRRRVSDAALEDLSRSIAEKGILQPILVRRHPNDPNSYEIIAGERRWRAAQMVPVHTVPVMVRDLSDREALEIALIENLQRQDLSPLEEAEGYRRLLDEFAHSQENLAQSVGKSRSHVANTMRLLGLPEPVKNMLDQGQLSAGHARALIGARDPLALAEMVVKRGLNVRQTEQLAKLDGSHAAAPRAAAKDTDTLALERDLGNLLGLAVEIKLRRNGGALVLNYSSLEQLDDILHRLSQGRHGGRPNVAGGGALNLAERRWSEAGETDAPGETDRGEPDPGAEDRRR
jgi:ParB family chromosome partitioning protein